MEALDVILYTNGIENCTVFYQASWKQGEKGKVEIGKLADEVSPHKVAREIYERFGGKDISEINLIVPQSRAELPENCQSHRFGIYPSMLGQESQEYLRTLFPGEVRVDYAESIKELKEISQREKNGI